MEGSFDWKRLDNRIIIIFGSQMAAQAVYRLLRNRGLVISGFYDNNALQPFELYDLPVARMDLQSLKKENVVFILTMRNISEAIHQLEENGIHDYIPAYALLNEETRRELSFMEQQKIEASFFYYEHFFKSSKLNLHSLDLVITEKCSLRCKECSNLMQYYSTPKNISLDKIKKDLDGICNIVDEIYEIRIIGGEPFMSPQWPAILKYVATKKNIRRICFFTNGTIYLTDSQCRLIKDVGAWLSISDYGELSCNLKKILLQLEKYNIPYECKSIPYWTKCATFNMQKRTNSELAMLMEKCCAKNLTTLLLGRVYPCPFIANAINLTAIPENDNDYVQLDDGQDLDSKKEALRKLLTRHYYGSCAFCIGRPTPENIREDDKIPPHEQINAPLSYEKMEVIRNARDKRYCSNI